MDEDVRRELAQRFFDEAYRRQQQGAFEEAVELYQKSIESLPTAEAHTFLGWTYSMMGRLDDAIAECHKAIAIDPADLVVNYNVACTYAALGELERALARIRHAIPDDPVCRRAFTDWMKMDISLDPLRPLPEFQRLMHELEREFPDEPKAMPLLQSA